VYFVSNIAPHREIAGKLLNVNGTLVIQETDVYQNPLLDSLAMELTRADAERAKKASKG